MSEHPKDKMFYIKTVAGPFRWKEYKPQAKKQMKREGRWQEGNEWGGWDNCDLPAGTVIEEKNR